MSNKDQIALGDPLPAHAGRHALVASLPTWSSVIAYKEDDPRVTSLMQAGYPRFWIHWNIRKLSRYFEDKYATGNEMAMLLCSATAATECQAFLRARDVVARILDYKRPQARSGAEVHVVFYPPESVLVARQFWQHTGLGISTRLADYYIALLDVPGEESVFEHSEVMEPVVHDPGENLTAVAENAKIVIRRRLAKILDIETDAVWLYCTGMHAIWFAHQVCMSVLGQRKSVCFGFPYVDTLKVLEKWGPGCHFFPDGSDEYIDELDQLLAKLSVENPSSPPILALFAEVPSNPLLRSVNLPRLRLLADKYDFPIVIDDTIGNFANVNALPFADILTSSLSKLFSGRADVMGGSLILNTTGKYRQRFRDELEKSHEDMYFDEDVIIMERNSRDFEQRNKIIDTNTEAITEFLRSCTSVIKDLYYPKWQTSQYYDICRRQTGPSGGYGGLFSILFSSVAAAQGFFDALPCPKGPSFGTNFTLVCPWAIISHYRELDWAAEHGVPLELVRVWIGLEPLGGLMLAFSVAVQAAEQAHERYAPGHVPEAVWTL
ncbi:pyridoxal phosphate-dependent transferase [Cytidiella melzeri]|nr:pyridoxal phosphate-dependent transferase [Cytidiella melzeri]